MKKSLFALSILLSLSVVSQVVATQKQEKKFKMEFTGPELDTMIKGLGKLPYDESAGLINSIIGQAQRQMQAPDSTIKKK